MLWLITYSLWHKNRLKQIKKMAVDKIKNIWYNEL